MLTALDVRTLPPRDRHAEFFRRFDALAPGAWFVLVNDHDPKPLLYQLQAERKGTFEWNVLERGPARFRVEIRRRAAPGDRTVSEYLGVDHDRLDATFEAVEKLVGRGDFAEALFLFLEFKVGLARHIDVEEGILFPEAERIPGMIDGPTNVMRFEHKEILGLLGELEDALRTEDTSGFIGAAGELREVLGDHNMKEERILYPLTDEGLGAARADELVRAMQAY